MFYWPNKPVRVYDPHRLSATCTSISDWLVQPKWNGKRVEISCDVAGHVILYGRQNQIFKERWDWLADLPIPRPWFLDGELLRDSRIYCWDYAVAGGQEVYRDPYLPRLQSLQAWIPVMLTNGPQRFACAETLEGFEYRELLAREGETHLEGIVWKRKQAKDLWGPHTTNEVGSCIKYRFNP